MREITVTHDFEAPVETVFAALADQDGMGKWMRARISVPTRSVDGLVGTVRRIHLGRASLDERIIACEPPGFLAYQIVTPLPLLRHHRGEMRIEPLGERRARLTWRIVMELEPAIIGALVLKPLGLVLERGLTRLARQLAR